MGIDRFLGDLPVGQNRDRGAACAPQGHGNRMADSALGRLTDVAVAFFQPPEMTQSCLASARHLRRNIFPAVSAATIGT
jgi:hypothetical protein